MFQRTGRHSKRVTISSGPAVGSTRRLRRNIRRVSREGQFPTQGGSKRSQQRETTLSTRIWDPVSRASFQRGRRPHMFDVAGLVCLWVCLSVCPSVCLSVCLSVSLCLCVRERETDRQTDREADRQTDRHTHTHRDTDRQTDGHTDRQTHRQTRPDTSNIWG